MTPSYKQRGLTLVELLISLAIVSALMAPLAAMLQSASDSSLSTRAALGLNREARFALDRIARSAAAAPAVTVGGNDASTWLQTTYAVDDQGKLVETDTTVKPTRTSIVAANVSAFQLSVPDIGAGQAWMKIDMTLASATGSVSVSRLVRVGSPQ